MPAAGPGRASTATVVAASTEAASWPDAEAELAATAERLGVQLRFAGPDAIQPGAPAESLGTILVAEADPLDWLRKHPHLAGGSVLAVLGAVPEDELAELDRLVAKVVHGRGANSAKWALRFLAANRDIRPQDFAYGSHRSQRADRRAPGAGPPAPVAVLLHGGFWRRPYERDMVEELAADLARRGFASWNLDYRSAEAAPFPAMVDDVTAGLELILEEEGRQGNRGSLALVGHSAGAHLALLALARSPGLAARVMGVWAMAPVTDLSGSLPDDAGRHLWPGRQASKEERLGASPAHVDLPRTAVHLVHGAVDVTVPPEQSRLYHDRLAKAHSEASLLLLARTRHMDLTKADGWQWRLVADHLSSLARCA